MKIVIMSGISGSGKNTYIKNRFGSSGNVVVCSADDFFETATGYQFDMSKLSDAHSSMFAEVYWQYA